MDEQTIKDAYHNLPDLVRDIINNSKWEKTIRDITNTHKLLINQGLVLEDETLLTMLGISRPENFVESIMNSANIEPHKAIEIGKEIKEKIFDEIKSVLRQETERSIDDGEILIEPKVADLPPAPAYRDKVLASGEVIDIPIKKTEPLDEPILAPKEQPDEIKVLEDQSAPSPLHEKKLIAPNPRMDTSQEGEHSATIDELHSELEQPLMNASNPFGDLAETPKAQSFTDEALENQKSDQIAENENATNTPLEPTAPIRNAPTEQVTPPAPTIPVAPIATPDPATPPTPSTHSTSMGGEADFISQKLQSTTLNQTAAVDATIPTKGDIPPKPAVDPYRESIE